MAVGALYPGVSWGLPVQPVLPELSPLAQEPGCCDAHRAQGGGGDVRGLGRGQAGGDQREHGPAVGAGAVRGDPGGQRTDLRGGSREPGGGGLDSGQRRGAVVLGRVLHGGDPGQYQDGSDAHGSLRARTESDLRRFCPSLRTGHRAGQGFGEPGTRRWWRTLCGWSIRGSALG